VRHIGALVLDMNASVELGEAFERLARSLVRHVSSPVLDNVDAVCDLSPDVGTRATTVPALRPDVLPLRGEVAHSLCEERFQSIHLPQWLQLAFDLASVGLDFIHIGLDWA
jgi:hypothetical protein